MANSDSALQVSIGALIVSFISFCWTVFWSVFVFRNQNEKAREEAKQRVSVHFVNNFQPAAKVINISRVPIFITGVNLNIERAGRVQQLHFQTVFRHHVLATRADGLGQEVWQLTGRPAPEEAIAPFDACYFVLPQNQSEEIVRSARWKSHPDEVSLTVNSHAEVLIEVKGDELFQFFNTLERFWDSLPIREAPK